MSSIVVTEFTLAGTRDAIRILSWLKANAPQARVAGRRQPRPRRRSRRSAARISSIRSSARSISSCPFDPKAAAQSAKLGQPLAKVAKSAKLSQPLNHLLSLALEQGGEGDAVAAAGRRRLAARQARQFQVAGRQEAEGRRPPDGAGRARPRRGSRECPSLTMILMVAGLAGTLLLVYAAFAGPSADKCQQRRLEGLRERHSRSSDIAAQAQMKRIYAAAPEQGRRLRQALHPEARPAPAAPEPDRQELDARAISAGLGRPRRRRHRG